MSHNSRTKRINQAKRLRLLQGVSIAVLSGETSMSKPTNNTTGIRRSKLSHQQVIRLSMWFSNKRESLASLKPTKQQASEIATKELGFEVVPANFESVLSALGIKSEDSPFKILNAAGTATKRKVLDRLDKLREAVCLLYNKVGESVPEDIGLGW